MITYSAGGRLGNQLFQYVSARLLAERLKFHFGNNWEWNDTILFTSPAEGSKFENDSLVIQETLHTKNIFERNYENRHYHLQGFWQNANYYIPHLHIIKSWILNKATNYTDKENIVMHVRLRDYKIFGKNGNVLHQNYYLDCLKKEKFTQLFIVTDDSDDNEYFKSFKEYNPIFISTDEKSDFWFLTEFDRIIIGNSTFSWWAAFLSNAKKVYTPKCWIRNCNDLTHNLTKIGIEMEAGFLDIKN